ncbi:MAG: bifunctional (p)ppGpp synthetase/guanosine-3',5'-bis(diphosphate) 3'-pyrophosphohydrolase [Bifidobacteriaceae bacterium]|jgi:GTP pyrophosphokinase|nr:bifunctional (p)ppGpp synthetase/guanosine-3',5'-bis(diphosphate) 3'-pyrophosphohydrolase [Bifidobacteriaceae bacterium]
MKTKLVENPDELFVEFLSDVNQKYNKADIELIKTAYSFAKAAHGEQKRYSGEPFIIHPISVAQILLTLDPPVAVLQAALLHDTVEDTPVEIKEIEKKFGSEVAVLVDGVTKLDSIKAGPDAEAETVRKMIITMSRDIRVLVIKLADRLHNARTWEFAPVESAKKKAQQTLEIYAPLADRMGLGVIKLELENLSFQTLHPKIYDEIVRLVESSEEKRNELITNFIDAVRAELEKLEIKADITGRPKHYYSIYLKMVNRGVDFHDMYDLLAIRILVDSVRDCYGALGAIHAIWPPISGRFKDYIARPKYNGYQSLHTSVSGPGSPIEVQIRTYDMHHHAEYGVAAHWIYKEKSKSGKAAPKNGVKDLEKGTNLKWLNQLLDWQSETQDSKEFLESLRTDLGPEKVYVFTPQGKVTELPDAATPVDFAYSVHTRVGESAIGAKVNGKMVTLDTILQNGDTVEILTSKSENAGPSADWLEFVKSPRAKNKIRQWFSKSRREQSIEEGHESLSRALEKEHIDTKQALSEKVLKEIANQMNLSDTQAIYASIGEGKVSTMNILNRLKKILGVDEKNENTILTSKPTKVDENNPGVIAEGVDSLWIKLAKCCLPVPGDEIVGFITKGHGITVHRSDCKNVKSLTNDSDRFIDVQWSSSANARFNVRIKVEAIDRDNLLSELSSAIAENHVSTITFTATTTENKVAIFIITVEIAEQRQLNALFATIRKIDGVYDVFRTKGE